jgi:hypothetical protein
MATQKSASAGHTSLNWIDWSAADDELSHDWNELAESSGSPFLTMEWL